MKTLVVLIYLPDSIAWRCTLLKLLCIQHIDFHHTLALDSCSLLSLFVCHWYSKSYYMDSTCSSRSSHRELAKSKNKYLNQLSEVRHVFIKNLKMNNSENYKYSTARDNIISCLRPIKNRTHRNSITNLQQEEMLSIPCWYKLSSTIKKEYQLVWLKNCTFELRRRWKEFLAVP